MSRVFGRRGMAVGWICMFMATAARAQDASAPPTDPAGAAPVECEPRCRTGFTCVKGQCVSLCNPACAPNEQCSATGDCVTICNPPCGPNMQCTPSAQCEPAPAPPSPPPAAPKPTAQPPYLPPPQEPPPPPPRNPNPTVRFHDGFYFRLGMGIGAIGATVEASDVDSDELQITGLVIPVELAFGGTPAPGIVLGGGIYGIHVPSAHYARGRGDFAVEETADYGSVSMIGPFIDAYPDPKRGFHVQAAPCFTAVTPGKSDTIVTEDVSGTGFGAMVGLGYEGWIGEQWGLGLMARLQYASAKLKDEDDNEYDFKMLVPAVLLTATMH